MTFGNPVGPQKSARATTKTLLPAQTCHSPAYFLCHPPSCHSPRRSSQSPSKPPVLFMPCSIPHWGCGPLGQPTQPVSSKCLPVRVPPPGRTPTLYYTTCHSETAFSLPPMWDCPPPPTWDHSPRSNMRPPFPCLPHKTALPPLSLGLQSTHPFRSQSSLTAKHGSGHATLPLHTGQFPNEGLVGVWRMGGGWASLPPAPHCGAANDRGPHNHRPCPPLLLQGKAGSLLVMGPI